jgi:Ca2+-binding EF-hand superfamily protein
MSVGLLCSLAAFSDAADPKEPPKEKDKFAVRLLVEDVTESSDILQRVDENEDGYLDASEYQRLPWAKKANEFDINQDQRLTQIELCLWAASERDKLGINRRNLNGAKKWLDRYDLNGNGWLDPDEIADGGWPTEPKEFDTDKNGTITLKEIAAHFAAQNEMRASIGIEPFDQVRAIQVMKYFDKDGDQQLNAEEAKSAPLPQSFSKHTGVDGLLSILDLGEMFVADRKERNIDPVDQNRALQIIFQIDVNRDYVVDQEELVSRNAGHLKSFDINQDGVIKLDEIVGELGKAKKQFGYSSEDENSANLMTKRHDSNRNGMIEANELFKPSEAAQGRLTSDLLATIDTDGNKSLSVHEIATWLAKKRAK